MQNDGVISCNNTPLRSVVVSQNTVHVQGISATRDRIGQQQARGIDRSQIADISIVVDRNCIKGKTAFDFNVVQNDSAERWAVSKASGKSSASHVARIIQGPAEKNTVFGACDIIATNNCHILEQSSTIKTKRCDTLVQTAICIRRGSATGCALVKRHVFNDKVLKARTLLEQSKLQACIALVLEDAVLNFQPFEVDDR